VNEPEHLFSFLSEYKSSKSINGSGDNMHRTLMKTTAKAKNEGMSGSTGTLLLLNSTTGIVGWLGDSRAVGMLINGSMVEITQDHTASREDEKIRVRKCGGTVDRKGRLNKTLAVSRGFGDLPHKVLLTNVDPNERRNKQMNCALLAYPDVYQFERKDVYFIIIASDGIWDVVSNEEAICFVTKELNECCGTDNIDHGLSSKLNTVISKLVHLAIDRGSQDNVSAVLVWINVK
jgi:serine/threonine protein phosphatase PrpC